MPNNPDLNYKEDLKIDRYNLDLEWANNPTLFAKWAEKLVDCENHRDRLKDRIELKYANLDSLVRLNPKGNGVSEEKPTEKAIKSAIIKNQEYRDLQEEYLKAKHAAGILRVAVRSFKNREKAIDRETKLYLAQYYMKPYGKEKEELVGDQHSPTDGATAALNAHMKFRKGQS